MYTLLTLYYPYAYYPIYFYDVFHAGGVGNHVIPHVFAGTTILPTPETTEIFMLWLDSYAIHGRVFHVVTFVLH